jgi:serine/threonine protein kinase
LAETHTSTKKCPACGYTTTDQETFCPKDGTILDFTLAGAQDPLIGVTYGGKYRIVDRIGGGGMGIVYKAEHTLLNHIVALKILRVHLASDDEFIKRFQREARTACKLNHPNTITLHDFGVEEGNFFLAMEFIQGETLRDLLKREGALPLPRTFALVNQIAGAIAEAHSHGIIHRDLKPENIMVVHRSDGSDWSKVLDFGIAKQRSDAGGDSVLTKLGTIFGSPKYMAPEQSSERPVDTRADLYSLGCVLYEMVTGEPPFDGSSAIETILKHVNAPVVAPSTRLQKSQLPKEFDAVVMRLLEKDPDKRYQTAEEFLRAFNEVLRPYVSPIDPRTVSARKLIRILLPTTLALCLFAAYSIYKDSSRQSIDPDVAREFKELEQLRKDQEELALQAAQRADEMRKVAQRAAYEAEERKKEAEKALEEVRQISLSRTEEEKRAQALSEELEQTEKLLAEKQSIARKAESELNDLQTELNNERARSERLKSESEAAAALVKQQREEAERVAGEAEAHRAAREAEEKKAAELKLEAERAAKRTEELKRQIDGAEAAKRAVEAQVKSEKARSEEIKRPVAKKEMKPELSEAEIREKERRRLEAIRQERLAHERQQQAIEEARRLEEERKRAELAAQQAEQKLEEERAAIETDRRRPRQGKKR